MIAFSVLTAEELGDRQIRRGDEVITVACAFPTTVTPILQYGAVPVFVDVTVPQYNIDTTKLEEALSEKTKAVMIAHTLSIVKNADQILVVADGRIAESGTHDELLTKGGKYAAMWNAEQKISA